jgi:hypothetical protein
MVDLFLSALPDWGDLTWTYEVQLCDWKLGRTKRTLINELLVYP